MYERISSPVDYGGLTLKNRIIFAPTTLGLSEEEQLSRLEAIAAGGCAMIILGDVPVGRHGFGPDLYSRKGFAHYKRLTDAIHRQGCLVCSQLHQSDSDLLAMLRCIPGVLTKRLSSDDLRAQLNRAAGPYITRLPARKVAEITASFGEAAVRARAAGFDLVQVHGDRMCGSFSSPLFNHRTDDYGGGPVHRARFAVEAVSAIRRRCPDLPIDFKLAVRMEDPHYGNAGVLVSELPVFLPMLEKAGAPASTWPWPTTPPSPTPSRRPTTPSSAARAASSPSATPSGPSPTCRCAPWAGSATPISSRNSSGPGGWTAPP